MKLRYGTRRIWILELSLMMMLFAIGCGGSGGSDGGGNSDAQRFSVEFSTFHFRNYQTPTHNLQKGIVGLADDSGPIQVADVVEVTVTNSSGVTVVPTDDGVYTGSSITYDCLGSPCTQTGPEDDGGVWINFDVLPADSYFLEIEMSNGQMLNANIDFPGQTLLPTVTTAAMSSSYIGGDLELVWANPTGAPNWDLVGQLRVVIYDSSGLAILYIRLLPTDTSVIIPASLVAEATAVGDGSMYSWTVQTRAYDASDMNYARGYSNRLVFP